MRSAEEFVAGTTELAVLPAVYQRVREVMDDPDSSTAALADVLSADAAMTARLLHVVNSVYFGMMSRVETVTRAVNVLGMQQVHDIVLATSIANMFQGMNPGNMNMTRYWSNSVLRALVARIGAEMTHAGELERYFVAGLLSDLGHLVLYRAEPILSEQAQQRALRDNRPLHEVEREMLGCDYAEVGAALMGKWQLPDRLRGAIAGQIAPASAGEAFRRDAALLHLGRVMVDGIEQHMDTEGIAKLVDAGIWTLTGLKPANLSALRTLAEMGHAEVVTLFFPRMRQ